MSQAMTFGKIYNRVAKRSGFIAEQVAEEEQRLIIEAIADALCFAWNFNHWPKLMEVVAVEPRLATDDAQGPVYADATAEQLASGRGWYLDTQDFTEGRIKKITHRHPWVSTGWLDPVIPKRVGGRLLFSDAEWIGGNLYIEQLPKELDYEAALWSEAETYVAGDVVLWSTRGAGEILSGTEVWRCASAAAAGESPATAAAKWTVQPVPDYFTRYAVECALSMWLNQDGELDKEQIKMTLADKYLLVELDREENL